MTGVIGTGSNQLNSPWDLVLTYDYSLYIVDRFNNRIQKYLRDSLNGVTVAGQNNGTSGTSNGTLQSPAAMALDSDQNIYIADGYNHRVQFWKNMAPTGVTVAGTGRSIQSN